MARMPLSERLWRRVDFSSGCWLWTGATDPDGYGVISFREGEHSRSVRPHRLAYELLVGPIPDGLTIDHLCRNRACVRPDHLEPVTIAENVMRGHGPAARNALKTRCKHGHPYDEENTYHRPDGKRWCRACARAYAARVRKDRCRVSG